MAHSYVLAYRNAKEVGVPAVPSSSDNVNKLKSQQPRSRTSRGKQRGKKPQGQVKSGVLSSVSGVAKLVIALPLAGLKR